jgi:S1-C subfamily serine protease
MTSSQPETPAPSTSSVGLQPWLIAVITAVMSVVLTLATLWIFPNALPHPLEPIAAAASISPVASTLNTITTAPTASPAAIPTKADLQSFVAAAIQKVGPAVVRIDTERTISTATSANPFYDDPFFRQFFGNEPPAREYRQFGEGSGFIIDSEGMLLTNAHVVSGADTVNVTLKDGRTFKGEVRGLDEISDLAVVKINGKNLPVAQLGNSQDLQVGDWAIAVGNPLGLDNTVTLGIISTLNRSSAQVGIPDKRLDFIQTDAAINPGNSGGPLLNAQGQVIGINTAIRADAQGIGFAIPIDKAKEIKEVLAKGGKVSHPYLGIRMLSLTPELAKQINTDPNAVMEVPEINGVLVAQVIPNSPAAAGGLRRGDVITQINGKAVNSTEKLQKVVEQSSMSQTLQLQVQRAQQTQQIRLKPGELRDAIPAG